MKWHDAVKNPPDSERDVLISDDVGYASYAAAAYYNRYDFWVLCGDLLEINGDCYLEDTPKYWQEIDPPTKDNIE